MRVLPPFTSRRHLPSRLARLRELDGRHRGDGARPGHRVRLAARVRGRRRRALDRLAGHAPGRPTSWCAPGGRSATAGCCCVLDTGRTAAGRVGDAPRLDAAMDAALLLAALAARAGDRVDLLAYDRRVRARVEGVAAAGLLPALVNAMAPLRRRWSRPTTPGWSRPMLRPARAAQPGGAVHRAGRRAGRGGAAARARPARAPAPGGASPRSPTRGSRSWPRAAATPRRSTTRPPPSGPWPSGGGSPRCSAGAGSRWSTRPGRRSRRPWPTATSRSRPPAGSDRL